MNVERFQAMQKNVSTIYLLIHSYKNSIITKPRFAALLPEIVFHIRVFCNKKALKTLNF